MLCTILLVLISIISSSSSDNVMNGHAYNQPKLSVCASWYPSAKTIAGENSTNPQYAAIFVDKENAIYTTDQENGQLLVWLNRSSTPGRKISSDLINSSSLFVDINEHIYIDNGYQNKRVDKWIHNSTVGEPVINVNSSCTGLFIDQNQILYCSLAGEHRINKLNLTNSDKTIWSHIAGTGCPGPVSNMLDHPHGIFVDDNFNLYVADTYNNRIQHFLFGELNARTVAGSGSLIYFTLNRPTGIILDGYNNLYIVDSHNHRIIRSTQDECKCIVGCTETAGAAPNQLNYPHSMAFDNTGNIIVTDWKNRRIQLFYLASNSCVIPNIPTNARWSKNGTTAAGGHGKGNTTNQLNTPWGLFVDDNQTTIIADFWNHRIVQWKKGDTSGQVVAGGNGQGNRLNQLNQPTDVLIDEEADSLIICDRGNQRVVGWSRRSGTAQGEILIDNMACWGLAIDYSRNLYISNHEKHEVRRFQIGEQKGILVAGINQQGNGSNQLNEPTYIFVDRQQTVYVSDRGNHRVMKWQKGTNEGIVVAGGQGKGSDLRQLSHAEGLYVDTSGTLYVADSENHRVLRLMQGTTQGTVIMGANGKGSAPNQFQFLRGLSFDLHGNLYVVDRDNHRVQRFSIQ